MSNIKVDVSGCLVMEGAHIIFRNFEGRANPRVKFQQAGNRNFNIIIDDPAWANRLMSEGWNVKTLAPRSPDEEPTYHLPVAVVYSRFPPEVNMVTKKAMRLLNEDNVSLLDNADIACVDAVIRPYHWVDEDDGNRTKVKAYLKTLYAVIDEGAFADKYAKYDADNSFRECTEEEALPF